MKYIILTFTHGSVCAVVDGDTGSVLGANGININDPHYGMWLDEHEHLSRARTYNIEWEEYIKNNPNATKDEIMEKANELMREIYGQ